MEALAEVVLDMVLGMEVAAVVAIIHLCREGNYFFILFFHVNPFNANEEILVAVVVAVNQALRAVILIIIMNITVHQVLQVRRALRVDLMAKVVAAAKVVAQIIWADHSLDQDLHSHMVKVSLTFFEK